MRLLSGEVGGLVSQALLMSRSDYEGALRQLQSRFSETQFVDSDHAWLAPVKAFSDYIAVDSLIARGIVDSEFVADVLAVDFTRPIFLETRCSILRWVPEEIDSGWRQEFVDRLSNVGTGAAAGLMKNFIDSTRSE